MYDTTKKQYMSESRVKMLQQMPSIETSVVKSRDGKWIIHKTIITDIKPVRYYEKVLDSNIKVDTKEETI